jgi:hypothetical protein
VQSNDVYAQIIAMAKKKKCDLICMASHGRRGVAGVILGSETHKVLTHKQGPGVGPALKRGAREGSLANSHASSPPASLSHAAHLSREHGSPIRKALTTLESPHKSPLAGQSQF